MKIVKFKTSKPEGGQAVSFTSQSKTSYFKGLRSVQRDFKFVKFFYTPRIEKDHAFRNRMI